MLSASLIAAGTSIFERLVARHECCCCPDQPQRCAVGKGVAVDQDEATFYLSILTLGEYDKGIHNLPDDHVERLRYMAARDALAKRFGERMLSVSDEIIRRWGRISGEVKRTSGHARPQ